MRHVGDIAGLANILNELGIIRGRLISLIRTWKLPRLEPWLTVPEGVPWRIGIHNVGK